MILAASDFEGGKYQISYDPNTQTDLEVYLTDDNEKSLLYELMGKTEADAFIADLVSGVPVTAKWTAIFNWFSYNEDSEVITCDGLKEYLKGRVYYQYVSQQPIVNLAQGNARLTNDASVEESLVTKEIVLYNRVIHEGEKIQYYMYWESATYPDFNGNKLYFASPL